MNYYRSKQKKANEFYEFFWLMVKAGMAFMICSAIAKIITGHAIHW